MNYRSLLVDKVYGKKTGCVGCYKTWVLSVDAKLMFFFLIFIYFAFVLRHYYLRVSSRIVLLVFSIYYLTDVYLFKFLHQRLYFSDVATFFDGDTINEVFLRDVSNHTVKILLILLSFGFVFFHRKIKLIVLDKIIMSSLLVLFISLVVFVSESNYVNSVGIRNIVDINYRSKASIDYDESTLKKLEGKISSVESLSCKSNGLNLKKNVILLVWESLSMYHSNLFSGLNDWTPHLDDLAMSNRYYSNFYQFTW